MRVLIAIASLLVAPLSFAGSDAARGEQLSGTCAACHGPGGVSTQPMFPTLAGQHRDYLVESLKQYRQGTRKDPVMGAQAANLSDQDIKDLALYYATQPGPLYTPKIHGR